MTFTDPPYDVDYGSSAKDRLRGSAKILNDNLGTGFEAFLHDACVNILGSLRASTCACRYRSCIRCTGVRGGGGKWSTFVIWAKHTFTLGRADYQRQYEPILTAGRRVTIGTGAGPGTRATSGFRQARGTICIRP